jgi:hypothetical protein
MQGSLSTIVSLILSVPEGGLVLRGHKCDDERDAGERSTQVGLRLSKIQCDLLDVTGASRQ